MIPLHSIEIDSSICMPTEPEFTPSIVFQEHIEEEIFGPRHSHQENVVIDGIEMVAKKENDCDSDLETKSDLDDSSCWGSSVHFNNIENEWTERNFDPCYPSRQIPSAIRRRRNRRRLRFPRYYGNQVEEENVDEDSDTESVASWDSLECARRRGISGLSTESQLRRSPRRNRDRASRLQTTAELRRIELGLATMDLKNIDMQALSERLTLDSYESDEDIEEPEVAFRTYHVALK